MTWNVFIFLFFNVGDVLEVQSIYTPINNQQFSTKDRDNDNSDENPVSCAIKYAGGWWFNRCHNILLTGDYNKNTTDFFEQQFWSFVTGELKAAVMMIK